MTTKNEKQQVHHTDPRDDVPTINLWSEGNRSLPAFVVEIFPRANEVRSSGVFAFSEWSCNVLQLRSRRDIPDTAWGRERLAVADLSYRVSLIPPGAAFHVLSTLSLSSVRPRLVMTFRLSQAPAEVVQVCSGLLKMELRRSHLSLS